jgi:hypothetical protein
MLRKITLATIAAASLGVAALAGVSIPASAEPWGGPRYGGGYGGHHYGPPPWVRRWQWRRHHHYDPPASHGPRPGYSYGRPRHPQW